MVRIQTCIADYYMNWNLSLTQAVHFCFDDSLTLFATSEMKRPGLDKNRNDLVGAINIPSHVWQRCEEASVTLNALLRLTNM